MFSAINEILIISIKNLRPTHIYTFRMAEPQRSEKKVIMSAEAYKTIILYATRYANASIPKEQWREIYGILVGTSDEHSVIIDRAEAMTYGEATDVELGPEHYGFIAEIQDKLDSEGQNRYMVGWFHSHPGLGLFYSYVDIINQISFQGPNPDFMGLVFDHTYLLDKKKYPNHPGFDIYRLNDPHMNTDDPEFDNNYHKVDFEIIGLNEFFFANILTELSAYAASGLPLQVAYNEDTTPTPEEEPKPAEIMEEAKEIMDGISSVTETDLTSIPIPHKEQIEEEIEKVKDFEKLLYDGKAAFLSGDSFSGTEKYDEVIAKLEGLGDSHRDRLLDVLQDIAELCYENKHDNLTIKYCGHLKSQAEKNGNLYYMANADFYVGTITLRKGDKQKGLKILQNAAILFEKAEDFAGVGLINYQIGLVYQEEQDYESTCRFLLESIKAYTEAIHKFHPQRKSFWSLPAKLKETIKNLKKQIKNLSDQIQDAEVREKMKLDLEKA
jgi:proteasome lid subunit RPN8/RPN11/tetratricopeptide (TPR) repeat protein